MTTIKNMTEHDLTIMLDNGEKIIIPPSGDVLRCEETSTKKFDVTVYCPHDCYESETEYDTTEVGEHMIPVLAKSFGKIENLPPSDDETFYFVSQLVASHCPTRLDFIFPGELVRGEGGQIIGLKSFATMPDPPREGNSNAIKHTQAGKIEKKMDRSR